MGSNPISPVNLDTRLLEEVGYLRLSNHNFFQQVTSGVEAKPLVGYYLLRDGENLADYSIDSWF